jgi:universal stress protein F
MFKTILVPVDLADIDLARWSGGALRLVNVQLLLPPTFLDYIPADFDAQQKQRAESQLKTILHQLPVPPERLSFAVRAGSIYPEILAEAEAFGADLVVIGSHRPSMATYLLGSNATAVVRHATCSVLVVRA